MTDTTTHGNLFWGLAFAGCLVTMSAIALVITKDLWSDKIEDIRRFGKEHPIPPFRDYAVLK